MKKIIVIGASSGIGLNVVKIALSRGYKVNAFSRSANSINIDNPNLNKIEGDALNAEDVNKAIYGNDVVIQTLGVPFNMKLFTGPISLFSISTKNIISTMTELNVKRLISVTGFGAGDSNKSIHPLQRAGFNLIFGRAYSDKDKQEDLITASNLNWTIVRPGVLVDFIKNQKFKALMEKQEWRNGIISRYGVADFIVSQVDEEAFINKAPVLIS